MIAARTNLNKGFTLIELMTSLTLFMVVMTIAMGSVLGIFDSNRKTQSESTTMNNLDLAIETMSRQIRFGTSYHCGSAGDPSTPQNCPSGDNYFAFTDSDGVLEQYRLNGTQIERYTAASPQWIAVTAPELDIENLNFYVLGATPPPDQHQPKVVITVRGYSGAAAKTRTDFSLQTLVSERRIDNGQ